MLGEENGQVQDNTDNSCSDRSQNGANFFIATQVFDERCAQEYPEKTGRES